MNRGSIVSGLVLGASTSVVAVALLIVGNDLLGLPFAPFDVFEWITRLLPGKVLTTAIDTMVAIIGTLGVGSTSVAAKAAEKLVAIAMYVGGSAVLGALVTIASRRGSLWFATLAAALVSFLIALASEIVMHDTTVPGLAWTLAVQIGWGLLLAWSLERTSKPDRSSADRSPTKGVARRRVLAALASGFAVLASGFAVLAGALLGVSRILRVLPAVTQTITLECISNPLGGDLISTSHWTGVRLRDVLQLAGPSDHTRALQLDAADGFFESVAMSDVADERVLLIYAMNGVPLSREHGFPLRIYVPNRHGMKQPKWLTHIRAIETEWTRILG